MDYTPYGAFMRILRIRHHEKMDDTAKTLGVTAAFVSAVENGKKNVPRSWLGKLVRHYHLSETETDELTEAIRASAIAVKIPLAGVGWMQQRAATMFADGFSTMDFETAKQICILLEQQKEQ